ncbi:hypothetical protein GN958_ATG16373 [Phytophthora infestans]|uniref:Uncharacterized protein n=1 Tax=Phytophthora infestans TaxID=4787 RepID=A0A8S9U878_PHYIN|nr:hypothetical protein GN958_ATG16373 [Phytophthora infestans]
MRLIWRLTIVAACSTKRFFSRIFLRRENDSFRSAIPFETIPERFSIAEVSSDCEDPVCEEGDAVSLSMGDVAFDGSNQVQSHNQKYRAILAVCQRIAEGVTDKGKQGFTSWYRYLKALDNMVRDDKGLPMLDAERNGSGTLSSGGAGEADDDIGEFTTNLDELVPLDEEEQNIRETKRASKKLSSLSAKRKLELDETTEEKPPHKILDDDVKSILKKAKRIKEITDTLAYVDTVATVGDVTLEVLDEVVKTQQLSIAVVGDAPDGIRRMFDGAVLKRPKALVIKGRD